MIKKRVAGTLAALATTLPLVAVLAAPAQASHLLQCQLSDDQGNTVTYYAAVCRLTGS